jgi:hypothetical protein
MRRLIVGGFEVRSLGVSDPAKIGPYRTIAELGRGGMGRVLLCAAPDGRLTALKQVHSRFVQDDEYRARFRREVAGSRKVSGAYTAAVIDADLDAPTPYLVSVFVPGPSLREVVDAAGALPEEATVRLAAGLAAALAEIHRVGLVHRDLKPTNVLLAEDGPRVIDFGVVRVAEGDGDTLTGSGLLIGSPGYMSPEQATGGPITPASDLFSLGAVLVMACTGRDPFAGTSTLLTLYNVVHAEPDLSAIPPRLREIVGRCLAKDPMQRPTPAQVLTLLGEVPPSGRAWPPVVHRLIAGQRADLDRLLTGARDGHTLAEQNSPSLTPTPSAAGPAVMPAQRRRPARRRWPVAAGIVAVVAMVVAAVVLVHGYGGIAGRPPAASASSFATSLLPSQLPPGYVLCAVEGQSCVPGGTQVMAFGAGVYSYRVITGPTACSPAGSGGRDPDQRVLKSCFLAPIGGPSGYTSCATAGATCAVNGTREVAFGANGAFRFLTAAANIDCGTAAFGADPLPGVAKSCYLAPNKPPGDWTPCAAENGSCDVAGVQPLAFGANGAYVFGASAGTTRCTVDTFGVDPIANTVKNCYSWAGPPPGYPVECAAEDGNCSFTGEETVAFGVAGDYKYQTFTDGASCTVTAFHADPSANVAKACYLTR